MLTEDWQAISAALTMATGSPPIRRVSPCSGGDTSAAWRVEAGAHCYFVKRNSTPHFAEAFAAEAEGLRALAACNAVRTPTPICWGATTQDSFLVLEYLVLDPLTHTAQQQLGVQLAALHHCQGTHFGWQRNNVLGRTPQNNTPHKDWVAFWRDQRLDYQLRLARTNGSGACLQTRGEELLARLPSLFADYQPVPTLLHGDLWGGNAAALPDGSPVIFDPAPYYGDRETDIAMTELFGGFGSPFYTAYRASYPLDAGYPARRLLYNLYHLLNHFNLFGGGYLRQAEATAGRLLSLLRS